MKEQQRIELAVFDLDDTLIRANSSFRFCFHLIRARILPVKTLFLAWLSRCKLQLLGYSLSRLHKAIFEKILKGRSYEQLCSEARRFAEKEIPFLLNRTVIHYLFEAQKAGMQILILSSSPTFLVNAIGKHLGVELAKGADYEVDESGRLFSIRSLMEGKDKAEFISQYAADRAISLDRVSAFTDSILDLPLLLRVGHPIVVNPDRKLRRVALHHSWRIL